MFSLIVTTDGNRNFEFERLLKSLKNQTFKEFELVAILQTKNEETLKLVNNFKSFINIKQICYEKCSLSKARNIGLKIATGDKVAFPDDDCWYPDNLLETIDKLFDVNDVVCCNVFDPITKRYFSSRQCKLDEKKINIFNSFKYPISVGIFSKRDGRNFDESLGVGTIWGSGEETDYMLDKILDKKVITYYKNINVYHPYLNTKIEDMELKSYKYGKGFGALVIKRISKKQYGIIVELIVTILRSFAGVIVNLFKPLHRNIYLGRIKGVLYGLMHYKVN